MQIGFIGVGRIASALVEGLATTQPADEQVLLSPRGREQAARLAQRYTHVQIAPSNQAVVDAADPVFLCVGPAVAVDVLRPLRWRPGQLLISLVALTPLAAVQRLAPEATVVRAVPLPTASRRQSPTALFPPEPRAEALFDRLGAALPVDDERALHVVWATTGLIAPTFMLLDEVRRWLEREGVAAETAQRFTLLQFHSLLEWALASPTLDLEALAREAATPGGLNEQALRLLRQAGVSEALRQTLDALLARLEVAGPTERPGWEDQPPAGPLLT